MPSRKQELKGPESGFLATPVVPGEALAGCKAESPRAAHCCDGGTSPAGVSNRKDRRTDKFRRQTHECQNCLSCMTSCCIIVTRMV